MNLIKLHMKNIFNKNYSILTHSFNVKKNSQFCNFKHIEIFSPDKIHKHFKLSLKFEASFQERYYLFKRFS